jgi:lactoylglutathione lyase
MRLAKPQFDVGLMVRQLDPMLAFWQREVGLRFEQLLPTGGGNHQHRHAIHGSIMKLNASRDPQPETPPSGYCELWIARAGERDRALVDPDGNRVRLVAPGERGVVGIAMRVGVRDPDRHAAFYRDTLGLEADAAGVFVCGTSRLFVEPDAEAPDDASIRGKGNALITERGNFIIKMGKLHHLPGAHRIGRLNNKIGQIAHTRFDLFTVAH